MKKLIIPSKVKGKVRAPASKSMMQRAVACALLSRGSTILENPSFCDDSLASLEIAERLGCIIQKQNNQIKITSEGLKPCYTTLDCGEAGLCLRMFSPVAALCDCPMELTGRGSLMKRPAAMICSPLQQLGVKCSTRDGLPPVTICGPIKGGKAKVDGSVSSQFLTGLLLALPVTGNDSVIEVTDLKSRPYIDMTLKIQKDFGVHVRNYDYRKFYIPGGQQYRKENYHVEGDWSGASFLLVLGAISGELQVCGLDVESNQADRQILNAIEQAGATLDICADGIRVKSQELQPFSFDATDCPDLFPPLIALAYSCKGTSKIKGVSRLKHKESDRGKALRQEFEKLGAGIEIDGDIMSVTRIDNRSTVTDSHEDHRIAMALSVAATGGDCEIAITGAQSITKSYPGFFSDLDKLCGRNDE